MPAYFIQSSLFSVLSALLYKIITTFNEIEKKKSKTFKFKQCHIFVAQCFWYKQQPWPGSASQSKSQTGNLACCGDHSERLRRVGETQIALPAGHLSRNRREFKTLQDGGEEKEQLHFGQGLPKTHTLTCRKPAVIRSPTNVTPWCLFANGVFRRKKGKNESNLLKMA